MSKLKHILSAFAACFMAIVLVFAIGCGGGDDGQKPVEPNLQSITLDTTDVKKDYFTGQNFDETGLKLTANFKDGEHEELTVASAGVKVDYTKYNRKLYGIYPITVSYTKDGETAAASFDVKVTDVKLAINASEAKTTYIVNDDTAFSTDGFKVSVAVINPDGSTENKLLTGSEYTLTNDVNVTKVGKYSVTAKYNYNGYALQNSYPVEVVESRYGYEVTIKENMNGLTNVLTLDGSHESATVNLSKTLTSVDLSNINSANFVTVKESDKYGVVAENAPEVTEGLTIEVYKNDIEEPVTDLTNCTSGVYQVWVKGTVADKECEAFVIVYVIDSLDKIELKSDDESVKTEQVRGFENTIRPTWKFVVTYKSGATKVVNFGDAGLKVPEFSANSKNDTGSVTVTLTEHNASGVQETVECNVSYTLTGPVEVSKYVYFSANFITAEKGVAAGTVYENGGLELTLGGTFSYDANNRDVYMPEGILADNGKDSVSLTQRLKGSAGKTSTITFTANKDFTVYVWGISGNSSEDTRAISATGGTFEKVGEHKALDEAVDVRATPTVRAGKFTNIAPDTTITLDFGAGINVYYIVIEFVD